jgi:lipopolysaccharide exporter
VPRLLGIIASLSVAVIWRDFWALIIGTAVTRVCRVGMSYVMHPLRPRFSLAAWRDLIGFSLWTWAICVARVLRDQPSTFIVGRTLGPARVGMLSVGGEIALLPSTEIVLPMGRSMFSAFALARRTAQDVEAIFRRLVGVTAIVTLPASTGLALVAEPMVRLMFGASWMEAVPLVQVIAVSSAFAVLGHACHAQFDAFGLLRQDFSVILFSAVTRTGLIAALAPWFGLMGAVAGMALSLFLEPVVYLTVKWWAMPFSGRALAGVVVRPFLASAGMALVVSRLDTASAASDAGQIAPLALATLAGLVSYAIMILGLWVLAGRPAGAEADLLGALAALRRRRQTVGPSAAL